MTEFEAPQLTEAQQDQFKALTGSEYDNFALMSGFIDDEPAAVVVAVVSDGDGYSLYPLYVEATPSLLPRLRGPFGEATQ